MLRKLDLYIIGLHVLPFLGSILVITTVLLLDKIFDLMDLLIKKGVPFEIVLKLFLYALPFLLALSVPMSVLIASLIVFGNLSQNFEIIACKSCGISLKRLMLGPLIFAIFVFIFMVWFNDRILPESNHKFKNLLIDIYIKRPIAQIKAGVFNEVGNYKLYVRNKDDRTSYIEDVRIYDVSDYGKTFLTAKEGYIQSFQDSILVFNLINGQMHQFLDGFVNKYRVINFKNYEVIIKLDISMQIRERDFRSDREMNIRQLLDEYKRKKEEYKKASDVELKKYLKTRVNQILVEINKKFSLPFAAIVFVMLSAPISSIVRRGGFGTALGISFVIFTIYYIFLIGGEELAKKGMINGAIAMWFPNVFFFLIALYFIRKEEY
ncbi:MAG: LptF/LptG family permease [candidate division WOR-3 bacterium]|nr:LptF/LptG family permease [candidate division WOR-3 bacterium]MDW8150377.1 LptF/LptG family permease [candidate division WOR-3 bacterium]